MWIKCKECGAEFDQPSRNPRACYCSKECAREANRKRARARAQKNRAQLATCVVCGAELTGRKMRFCSVKCANKSRYMDDIQTAPRLRPVNLYECKRAKSCAYAMDSGGSYHCAFILFTGKSRPGYPAECKEYTKRKRGERRRTIDGDQL